MRSSTEASLFIKTTYDAKTGYQQYSQMAPFYHKQNLYSGIQTRYFPYGFAAPYTAANGRARNRTRQSWRTRGGMMNSVSRRSFIGASALAAAALAAGCKLEA
ncbi:MAG: twin-arginine translocation signal domain-containing protein, partial [Eggerthellaceae bacterium]|nr:twin-arginine translocation signal domain-containing protein [Eggerthellaceae bacterium]